MEISSPHPGDQQQASMEEQMLELMASGVSLGDIYDFTEQEYEAVYNLGFNLYQQGRYLDAMKAFTFLVSHNQFERRYYLALAAALQMLKNYPDAIQFYSMASVMDLEDPLPTFRTAECMLALGMYAEARQALKLVIDQSRQSQHALLSERATAMLALIDQSESGLGHTLWVDPARATSAGITPPNL